MALLARKAPAKPAPQPDTAPYRVPSLDEVDPDYAALRKRQLEIQQGLATLEAEASRLRRDIAADKTPPVRPGVAVLLGDSPVDSKAAKVARLTEVRMGIVDHEIAVAAVRERLSIAKGAASKRVRDIVRPEYGRRVAAVCEALKAVEASRVAYEDLKSQLEAEDVAWTGLMPMSLGFLGEHVAGRSWQIERVIRESREAGYVEG